ncbi:MAG: Rieske (2Fe-2S) domain protein [Ilumatobacteraceae bacterium]|nr:Rieske (2Fe-2S) domain protein [Ilumatobacteraceae bacterium]
MNGTRRPERIAMVALLVAAAAAVAFVVVFWSGGRRTQLEGALLALAFGGSGVGLVVWANHLIGGGEQSEDRTPLRATPEEIRELDAELGRGEVIARRVWLRRSAVAAGGALGIALVSPLRSLGPSPGKQLLHTAWGDGVRVVAEDGTPVAAADVPADGLVTVFPEGAVGAADAQAVLVRVDPSLLHLPRGRDSWAPGGLLAYSKVCTHAGCPVGLYQADSHELLCPCHQSSFDVLRGAVPVSGPAAWPLPQLPLVVGADGLLRVSGDFSEPVGPGWWKA